MAFLASLKGKGDKNPFAKFKEKEKEKDAIYVPFAECIKTNDKIDNDEEKNNDINTVNIKQLKIVTISDIHLKLKELKMVKGDILVLSGDYTNKGTIEEAKIVNEWLGNIKKEFGYKYIILISGNHEGYGDILKSDQLFSIENGETMCISDDTKSSQYQQQEALRIKSQQDLGKIMTNVTHYLYNESVTIENIKFYGSPFCPNLLDPQDRKNNKHYDRGFHVDVPGMKKIWENIPLDTEYLIVHSPPQGILDINGKGCSMLRLKLAQLKKLKVCQFGHVHSGYGHIFITKQSLISSIKHIDTNQQFKRTDFEDFKDLKYAEQLPFPIKLDENTRKGKSLKKIKNLKKEKDIENIDILNDLVLFINAATDGMEQPIYFNYPVVT